MRQRASRHISVLTLLCFRLKIMAHQKIKITTQNTSFSTLLVKRTCPLPGKHIILYANGSLQWPICCWTKWKTNTNVLYVLLNPIYLTLDELKDLVTLTIYKYIFHVKLSFHRAYLDLTRFDQPKMSSLKIHTNTENACVNTRWIKRWL